MNKAKAIKENNRWRITEITPIKFLLVDVETGNDVNDPLIYDIGYQIIDSKGKVYAERSMVIDEIFNGFKGITRSAYYKEKFPQYRVDLKNGKRELVTIKQARYYMLQDMKRFEVDTVLAYNAFFDTKALNNTLRYVHKSEHLGITKWGRNYSRRYFFPYGTKIGCVWAMACNSILKTKEFINFSKKHDFLSVAGNISTSAEIAYRYLINDPTFIEEHTGLEDVKVERQLFVASLQAGAKIEKPNSLCWRVPTQFAKENGLL